MSTTDADCALMSKDRSEEKEEEEAEEEQKH